MIFRKSLSKKKGASYSFFSGMSASFVPAVFLTLFLTLLMAVLPLADFISRTQTTEDSIETVSKTAKDIYKFLIFTSRDFLDQAIIYIVLFAMGILSILIAIRIFSFICDKKTVNVYYSLGIKRTSLFLTKYLSGIVLICASVIIPVILSYLVNLLYLGASWQLSLALLHLYCGLSVFLLICFSITAAVFSSVGTVSEAVVYSVAVLFAPTVIVYMTEQIVGAFLPSSTLNVYINHFTDNQHHWNTGESLLTATAAYNPLLFFAEDILTYACAMKENGEIVLQGTDSGWVFPNLLIHIPWFIIAFAAGVLGAFLFRRIKAENCGFLNTNKILSNLTIFELCLVGSSIMLREIEWTPVPVVLGSGVCVAFILYLVAEAFLKRNFKKIFVSLYKFVAHIAVIAIIFGICATGAFGYDKYIPDKSKIESAEIAVPFSYSEFSTNSMDYGRSYNGIFRMYEAYRMTYLPVMTDSEDIDTVMEINRFINETEADDGLSCTVIIRYNYKNGNFSERRHTLTSLKEAQSLLKIRDTKVYRQHIDTLFNEQGRYDRIINEAKKNNNYADESALRSLCFEYDYSVVTARAKSLQENRVLDLTKEEFNSLKAAVYKDITAMTSEEYFSSTSEQLGVLSFGMSSKVYEIEGLNGYHNDAPVIYEEGVTQTIIYDNDIIYDEEPEDTPVSDITEPPTEEDSAYKEIYYGMYKALGSLDYGEWSYDVIVTENMTNTLEELRRLKLEDCFTSSAEIESVSFRKYGSELLFGYYRTQPDFILEFFAYPEALNEYYEYEMDSSYIFEGTETENIIKDTEKIKELDKLMKLHEYTFDSGYYCLVKYKNNTYCIQYLSEDDAPDYVKNYNYTLSENDEYYY